MTNAMKRKAIETINEFRKENPNEIVHDTGFYHYGTTYQIREVKPNTFRICRYNPYSICSDYVDTFSM